MRNVKCVHMVGIGGSGMSGIAEVLLNLGYDVHGSDLSDGPPVQRLRELGARIGVGHCAENLLAPHVLVKSTAVGDDNPEVAAARERGIPVIPRAEMLAELMRLRTGIAIAGTHGKTTTTSFTAAIFDEAGLDPTVIIGGRLNAYGANARLGEGEFLIAEADESDGSFLCLFPIINVVTNVDMDHLDFYHNRDNIDEAFTRFMNKVPFYGLNVACGDDPGVRRILTRVNRPVLTYGFNARNNLTAEIGSSGIQSEFTVRLTGVRLGKVSLAQPGRHNVLNALAAIGVALQAEIDFSVCAAALGKFRGVGRRFEWKGEKRGVAVVDDYGHHPAEIAATLAAAKDCLPGRRLVVAFQPHRFTRTKALFGDFCKVFAPVDKLFLTEIYAASETPLPGISGEGLARGITQATGATVCYCQDLDGLLQKLDAELREGDALLTLGAGSITGIGPRWLALP
ncbi:MAG: UDP-N-acetylmuramate--L-alanine ligase [Desulfovibrio sp.]|nr:UDP-N-acetylmuramate--L-alanine ligase [Desulfovibrio sp.]